MPKMLVFWRSLCYNVVSYSFAKRKEVINMAAKRIGRTKNKNALYSETRSGFTIIEVVLVLAIAGLIFLMVFIALPQLQRAQRDTQRKQDISKLQSAITAYQGNNNGRLPTGNCRVPENDNPQLQEVKDLGNSPACRLIYDYMHGASDTVNIFVDPGGTTYKIDIAKFNDAGQPTFSTGMDYTMHVLTGAVCNGEEVIESNNPRDYAIVYRLEGSGVYCHGNNG